MENSALLHPPIKSSKRTKKRKIASISTWIDTTSNGFDIQIRYRINLYPKFINFFYLLSCLIQLIDREVMFLSFRQGRVLSVFQLRKDVGIQLIALLNVISTVEKLNIKQGSSEYQIFKYCMQ